MKPIRKTMRKNVDQTRKIAIISTFLIAIIFLIIYMSGYRLNGLSAARANHFIPKDSVLIDQVKMDWGDVYMFNTPDKPVTAVSIKHGKILWRSNLSTFYYKTSDPVQTIGGILLNNPNEKATVFTVLVKDRNVKFIEIGSKLNKIRKKVIIDTPITFSWPISMDWNDLQPRAYGDEGILYEYRYKEKNITKPEDLKWYSTLAE